MRTLPVALAAAVLLIAGSVRVLAAGLDAYDGTALLAAGLVTLGVWLGMEVRKGGDDHEH